MLCETSDTHLLLNNVCITSFYITGYKSAHGTLCIRHSNRCHNEVTNSIVNKKSQEYDFQRYYMLQYKYVFINKSNKYGSGIVIRDSYASVVVSKLFGINFYFIMYDAFVNKKYSTQMHSFIVKKRKFGITWIQKVRNTLLWLRICVHKCTVMINITLNHQKYGASYAGKFRNVTLTNATVYSTKLIISSIRIYAWLARSY